MTPARIGPHEVIYQNAYFQVYRVHLEFEGFQKELFVNDTGERAGLVIVRGGDVLLVRQYRYLVNQLAWEIPGGKIDEGETPEAAAVREALEETCLRCRRLKSLLYFHPGLDTHHNPTFIFSAEEFEEMPPDHLHTQEVSERVWVPLTQCVKMIFAGQIVDSLTIAALLAYHTRLHNPELAAL